MWWVFFHKCFTKSMPMLNVRDTSNHFPPTLQLIIISQNQRDRHDLSFYYLSFVIYNLSMCYSLLKKFVIFKQRNQQS